MSKADDLTRCIEAAEAIMARLGREKHIGGCDITARDARAMRDALEAMLLRLYENRDKKGHT